MRDSRAATQRNQQRSDMDTIDCVSVVNCVSGLSVDVVRAFVNVCLHDVSSDSLYQTCKALIFRGEICSEAIKGFTTNILRVFPGCSNIDRRSNWYYSSGKLKFRRRPIGRSGVHYM